jgi:hypothetical protein
LPAQTGGPRAVARTGSGFHRNRPSTLGERLQGDYMSLMSRKSIITAAVCAGLAFAGHALAEDRKEDAKAPGNGPNP